MSGDRTVTIGGLTIQIPFSNKDSTVSKTGTRIDPEKPGDDFKINWTITVNNLVVPANLEGWKLKDTMFAGISTDDIIITPSDVGSFVNNEFVFNDGGNMTQEITFTYTQTVTPEEYNTALLAAGNGNVNLSTNKT